MTSDSTRSWWKRHRRLTWILVGLLLFAILVVVIIYIYTLQLPWTGFNDSQGPNVLQYQSAKTLWDWLQLLIVPVVLSVAAYWFNRVNSEREQQLSSQRNKTEQDIALDRQRAVLLQDYLDRMSDLLIEHKFYDPQTANEASNIARARTLIVLPQLDGERKGRLIQFLYESKLVIADRGNCISLHNADLSEADLSDFDLVGINLNGANLSKAKLNNTNLSEAQLREARLYDADLTEAMLRSADLCFADLSGAKLNRTHLLETKLLRANLSRVKFIWTKVDKADFRDATMNTIYIEDTNFDDAILSPTNKEKIKQLQGNIAR